MESTQIQALYEPPLAAMPQLSEKPRQGFETRKTAGKPGSSSCNFTVALGLRATVVENGVRETYSARYYNPLTGRFLSRDPEEGNKFYPKALHKYLYASGDPVNAFDPTGKDSILETGAIDKSFVLETLPAIVKYSCAVIEIWAFDAGVANLLDGYITGKSGEGGWPEPPKWLDLACAIPGWMAAQAEFGELFGGGE